jgi:hypothetical protein
MLRRSQILSAEFFNRLLDHHRWPNSYFADLGVFNLEEARKLELMSLRVAANF